MKEIFVFGSNLAGRHGKGAARYAAKNHGAVYGQGIGLQGTSYAIPTKDENLNVLDLEEIARHVENFIKFAENAHKNRWNVLFKVTRIGCGLAGYSDKQIAPMFTDAPDNCLLPPEWKSL